MSTPIFLPPGAICCPPEPAVVTTILGSCVAVCLWDRQRRVGGMNHFLLPRCGNATPSSRYGDIAFGRLLAAMERWGCQPADLRAKVFGGAAVLPFGTQADTVGSHNIGVALEVLHGHGIPVVARRTGGQRGLFLRFHTAIGRVMVRELLGDSGLGPDTGLAAAVDQGAAATRRINRQRRL